MASDPLPRLAEKLRHLWQHLPLRQLGVVSAALPFVAVVASAVLAFVGNQNRQRTETAVTRHFETVERLDRLLMMLLNAETGLRGLLLTRHAEFLEPYVAAQHELPGELDDLRRFVEEEPGTEPRRQKRDRLEAVRATVDQEMSLLTKLRDAGGDTAALTGPLAESKALMDRLRDQLRTMQNEEKSLLGERLQDIRRVRRRDYLTVSLALLLGLVTRGLAFWLFNRRVVRRIEHLTANVRALCAGQPLPNPASDHQDAIGEMERELFVARARFVAAGQAEGPPQQG